MLPIERSAAYEWGFEKGEQAERERIIKLVEKLSNHGMTHSELCTRMHILAEQLIAEIKGENK